jgi:hypothetical protein
LRSNSGSVAIFTAIRRALEYRELLDKAGFQLMRVVPTESAVSVVEAVPV